MLTNPIYPRNQTKSPPISKTLIQTPVPSPTIRTLSLQSLSHLSSMSKLAKLTSALKNLTRSKSGISSSSIPKLNKADLRTVLVGKSRRRYLLSSDLLQHPLIRLLVDNSSSSEDGVLVVSCEVVMFDHLLWMLENSESQLASCSIDELVEFYSY